SPSRERRMAKRHQYKIKSKKNRSRAGRKWRHVYNGQLRELQGQIQRGQQSSGRSSAPAVPVRVKPVKVKPVKVKPVKVKPVGPAKELSCGHPRLPPPSLEAVAVLVQERFPEFATGYLPAVLTDSDDQVLESD